MTIGTIKQILQKDKILLSIILLLLQACSNNKKCTINNSNESLIQEYKTSNEILSILQIDNGVFGLDIKLRICNNTNNDIIEEINLRGDDYLPKIDSVIGTDIYIHYNFPRGPKSLQVETLDFESVVLGEALINRENLKYNYIIRNKKTSPIDRI